METLEASRVCRLCGKQSGISINIFDKNDNHIKKIKAVLPIMVHEMDMLPKHMCHRCSYKLEEFYKFYVECLRTDADLKSQLSWMRKKDPKEKIGIPMVQIENVRIKEEPPEYDIYELGPIVENVNYINSMNSMNFPVNCVCTSKIHDGLTYATYGHCRCYCDKKDQRKNITSYETTMPKFSSSTNTVVTDTLKDSVDNTYSCNLFTNQSDVDQLDRNLASASKNSLVKNPLQNLVKHNADIGTDIKNVLTFSDKDIKSKITTKDISCGSFITHSSLDDQITNIPQNSCKLSIVRDLRPRKSIINYFGVKKKSSQILGNNQSKNIEEKPQKSHQLMISRIKVEKVDEFEGRLLRPRKRKIDYFGAKKKVQSSFKKHKIDRMAREKVLTKTEVVIKQEADVHYMLRSNENPRLQKVLEHLPSVSYANKDMLTLVKDRFPLVKNVNPIKSTRGIQANKNVNEFNEIYHEPKYLRGHSLRFKDTRLKRLANIEKAIKSTLNHTCINMRSQNNNNTLTMKRENINGAIMKTINNTKYFCERCNFSFASKELFKLHACYQL